MTQVSTTVSMNYNFRCRLQNIRHFVPNYNGIYFKQLSFQKQIFKYRLCKLLIHLHVQDTMAN